MILCLYFIGHIIFLNNALNNFCYQGIILLTLENFILLCEVTYSLDFLTSAEAQFATPDYASLGY